jgi:hypothetical protein
MALLRERVPAAAAALVGVVLALPSVVAPTWQLTTLGSERGVVLFDQQEWSWGRSQVLGAGGSTVQDLGSLFGLVVLVGLLVVTAAGAVASVLSTAPWAAVAGLVASAALLGRLATTVSERLGRSVRDDVHGLAATGASTSAGALESLAAVALGVAVALMVVSGTGRRKPSARLARLRAVAGGGAGDPGRPDHAVRASAAGVRASAAGARATITSRPDGEHLSGPAVELGDEERRR